MTNNVWIISNDGELGIWNRSPPDAPPPFGWRFATKEEVRRVDQQAALIKNVHNEGENMTEGQSRYGIMDEMNNRKVKVRAELSKYEREKDELEYNTTTRLSEIDAAIKYRESSYEQEHRKQKRFDEVQLQMMQQDHARYEAALAQKIIDEEASYKKSFIEWKNSQSDNISVIKKDFEKKEKELDAKISELKITIIDIEQGIADLKEISKEVGTKAQ